MKWLYQRLKSYEHLFEKGAKFEKLYPLYEAVLTIHFSTTETTKRGAHVRDGLDTKRFMILVVIALLPVTLFGIYNAGYQSYLAAGMTGSIIDYIIKGVIIFMPILLTSYAVGGLWEVLFAIIRKHEINEGFLVSGLLFPLTLPPTIPLWQVALGISFGIVVGKEVFGGTGKNFLNPALTARAFVYFSYPAYLSGNVWTSFMSGQSVVSSYSSATPLGIAANTAQPNNAMTAISDAGFSLMDCFLGLIPGSVGETSVLLCLVGAAILIGTGVGSWRTMVSCVLGVVAMAGLFNLVATETTIPFLEVTPIWHLFIGSFAFGAVFMATDPVSSPDLNASKWIYGFLIGVLTVIIRAVNPAYPEGVMLAILLMNIFAPLIDFYVAENKVKKRIPNAI
ncbi:MAG: NADH:ubiquinone reductase (Na(+)-transporting) subunit B [Candidatus Marinamargulisbacteria bacterium]